MHPIYILYNTNCTLQIEAYLQFVYALVYLCLIHCTPILIIFVIKWLNEIIMDCTQQGFGNLDGEYWLGLEHLYWLTSQVACKLRVSMEDWQGRQMYAEYDSFRVEPESDWFRLRLGSYQGNAGDSLSWHNNKAFTTLDRDKDAYSGNPSYSLFFLKYTTMFRHFSDLCLS